MTISSDTSSPETTASSFVTVTTVAEGTRIRGSPTSPPSSVGAAQTSTTEPAATASDTSPAVRITTLVVVAASASSTAACGTSSPARIVRVAMTPGSSEAGETYVSPADPRATSTTRRSSAVTV